MTKLKQKYKFLRPETGKQETVLPEIWQWEAHYKDGLVLKQFDDQGVFHQLKEIDQKKLEEFKMISPNFPQTYSIIFDPLTMELIHFYRNIVLNAATEFEKRLRLYCFGYEKRVGGEIDKVILAITPESGIHITDNMDQISFKIGY